MNNLLKSLLTYVRDSRYVMSVSKQIPIEETMELERRILRALAKLQKEDSLTESERQKYLQEIENLKIYIDDFEASWKRALSLTKSTKEKEIGDLKRALEKREIFSTILTYLFVFSAIANICFIFR